MFWLAGLRCSGSQADEGAVKAPGLAHTNMSDYLRTNNELLLSVKAHLSTAPSHKHKVAAPAVCFTDGFVFSGDFCTSARSSLLGISCSNTFSIDLYQRLCLQSECG